MVKVNSEIEAKNSNVNPITSETRSFTAQINYGQIHSLPVFSNEIRYTLMKERVTTYQLENIHALIILRDMKISSVRDTKFLLGQE